MTYSSKTIAQEDTSRNRNHYRAFAVLKTLIGEKPLVLDREFSYLQMLSNLVAEAIHFVTRLNLGSHTPTFVDEEGQQVDPGLSPGLPVGRQGKNVSSPTSSTRARCGST